MLTSHQIKEPVYLFVWEPEFFKDEQTYVEACLNDDVQFNFQQGFQDEVAITYNSFQKIYQDMIILEFTSLVGIVMIFYYLATHCVEIYRSTGFKDNFLMNMINRMRLTRYKGGPEDVKKAYKNMKKVKKRDTFKKKFATEDSHIGENISEHVDTIKEYIEADINVDQQALWF